MHSVTDKDKGTYKLVAKNEKGEVTSAPVEVTEIPETIKEEKPKIATKLKAIVSVILYSFIDTDLSDTR